MLVPNQFPATEPANRRLAIIGESPGMEEENWRTCSHGHGFAGKRWVRGELVDFDRCPVCASAAWKSTPEPFRGPAGRLLDNVCASAGLLRTNCFVGNVSRSRLTADEINNPAVYLWHLAALAEDLDKFRPNCVLLLGNLPLRAFHPLHWESPSAPPEPAEADLFGQAAPKKGKRKRGEYLLKIGDWRGSIFEGHLHNTSWQGKCVAAYHPAAILRSGPTDSEAGGNPEFLPLLRFDAKRAVEESLTPALNLPKREFAINLSLPEILRFLDRLVGNVLRVGFDIEGYAVSGVTDCSFATSPESATWIPFVRGDGSRYWSPAEEQQLWAALKVALEDPGLLKIMHNASYEMFVLNWAHNIYLRGIGGDTMLAWHEFQPELDKALDVPASILCRQPYWKHLRETAATEEERAGYNCTDSCVTFDLDNILSGLLSDSQREHYRFNLSLLEPLSAMMLKGIRYDLPGRAKLISQIQQEVFDFQGELDQLSGIAAPTLAEVAKVVGYAKHQGHIKDWLDVVKFAKPSWKEEVATSPVVSQLPDDMVPF